MRRIANFMSGTFFGALVGATIAILLAPSSGDELRDTAQGRLTGFLDEVRNAAADRRAELEAQLAALQRGDDA